MQQSRWLTPVGLEDLLPPQASKLEFYRRNLLDGFECSGFDLVLPPIAEFTDALLTGTARHMAVDTCRFTDQESGHMMGVRADMTPQVARIVSNRLKSDSITKLCYVGEVLKTRNNKAKGSRSPMQIGAEIFGHAGMQSDIEIIELMLESMQRVGLDVSLSLGHVGIVDELISLAGLSSQQATQLIDIFERKAIPEFEAFVAENIADAKMTAAFNQVAACCGDAQTVLDNAAALTGITDKIDQAIAHLKEMVAHLLATHSVSIHLDFADLRGYQYHTGIIFAAYVVEGPLYPIAKGGRYDNIGSEFGLALPATGFSMDLRMALDLLADVAENSDVIFVKSESDANLANKIAELKANGTKVMKVYDDAEIPAGAAKLEKNGSDWVVV